MKQWALVLILSQLWCMSKTVNGGEVRDPIRVPGHLSFEDASIPRVRISHEEFRKLDGEGPRKTKRDLINDLRKKYGPDYDQNQQYLALRRNINMLYGNHDYHNIVEEPIFYIEEEDNKDVALLHAARLLHGVNTNEYRTYAEALEERERRYKYKLQEEHTRTKKARHDEL